MVFSPQSPTSYKYLLPPSRSSNNTAHLIPSRHTQHTKHQQTCPTQHLSVSAASPPTSKPKPPTAPSSSTSSSATNGSSSSPTLRTTLPYVQDSFLSRSALCDSHSSTTSRIEDNSIRIAANTTLLPLGLHDRTRRFRQARARIHQARRQAHRPQRKHH